MSDEFFYIEEVVTPELTGAKIEKWNQNFMKRSQNYKEERQRQAKKGQEIRIQEIEQHLKLAESKCNTLKGQVEHMRMMYTEMNTDDTNQTQNQQRARKESPGRYNRKASTVSASAAAAVAAHDDLDHHRELNSISNVSTVPHRDTNTTVIKSSAVKSINNIITDITHSVNRLTNLQVHIGSSHILHDAVGIQTVKCSPRLDSTQNDTPEKPYQTHLNDSVVSLKSNHQTKGKKKAKVISSKHVSNKKESSASIMKKMKAANINSSSNNNNNYMSSIKEKRGKVTMVSSATDAGSKNKATRRTRTQSMSTRTVNVKQSRSSDEVTNDQRLVELYHNSAVQMATASETEVTATGNGIGTGTITGTGIRGEENAHARTVPKDSRQKLLITHAMMEPNGACTMMKPSQHMYRSTLPAIQEYADGSALPAVSYSRSYEEPTIASKLKQVANNYFRNDGFRCIPFVAAKSTSPSHNLGVNIQQVLSIIKGRKPISGLSPTLTYNIQLAANKLGSRPLSALVSTLGSRMTSHRNPCPLIRRYPNFNNLQEMARDIPEETLEEMNFDEDAGISGKMDADVQASGDVNTWTVDPSKSKDKCTCLPKPGVTFNEVYHKYNHNSNTTEVPDTLPTKKLRKPWNPAQRYHHHGVRHGNHSFRDAVSKTSQINRRERSLKEVLTNLHDEFGRMNERYDDMKEQLNNNGGDLELVHLLEQLEKELQNKEDEITMVMNLYKEVLQLKQQVSHLKKRASACTIASVMPYQQPQIRQRTSTVNKDSNASGHLANLLRYVQQFQRSLKKTPAVSTPL